MDEVRTVVRQRRAGWWLWLAVAAAVLAIAGNVAGLADVAGIYGGERPALLDAAVAQDVMNLAVISPAVLVLALLAVRGSLGASLLCLGGVAFTVYNYVIYTFSLRFGPLFLLWVAVLGLSLFALIGGLLEVDAGASRRLLGDAPARLVGWFLVGIGALFALVWLRDIVPALISGTAPTSVTDTGLPTSPVHILDLAFFLPAVILVGVQVLRRRPFGFLAAPGLLVFLLFTCLPIIATPFVARGRGESASWAVVPPILVIAVASLGVLVVLMRAGLRSRVWLPRLDSNQ